ncbi:HAD family hydrolase [Capnocytophaga sputigena]|uniref:HAD family hydrolase n=1 Tax=Capnocytophaga sputigena TaxID=1019 RepID=UPI0028F06132|nr:HAD family hydrolase [Capnocytophaga sputigena]
MQISFDLDGTLIPYNNEFPAEKRSWWVKLLGIEPIRKGTKTLIKTLQSQGNEVHIYTTSLRSKPYIRRMFRYYGIKIGKIITQKENERTLQSLKISASKYPKVFGFDLHIDDAQGVQREAEQYDFKVIIISPTDTFWIEKILKLL